LTGAGDTYKGNGTVSVLELELNTALEELSVAVSTETPLTCSGGFHSTVTSEPLRNYWGIKVTPSATVKTDRRVGNYSGRTSLGLGTTSAFAAIIAIIRTEISIVDHPASP
jgi:hypothetical protein